MNEPKKLEERLWSTWGAREKHGVIAPGERSMALALDYFDNALCFVPSGLCKSLVPMMIEELSALDPPVNPVAFPGPGGRRQGFATNEEHVNSDVFKKDLQSS